MKNPIQILTLLYSCLLIAFIIVLKEDAKNIMWLFYFSVGFAILSISSLFCFVKISYKKKILKTVLYLLNLFLLVLSFLYALICLKELLERNDFRIFPITILSSFLIIVIGLITLLSRHLKVNNKDF
jgi:hypothetical protein